MDYRQKPKFEGLCIWEKMIKEKIIKENVKLSMHVLKRQEMCLMINLNSLAHRT